MTENKSVTRYTYTTNNTTFMGFYLENMKNDIFSSASVKYKNLTVKRRVYGAFYFLSDSIFNGQVTFNYTSGTTIVVDARNTTKSVKIGDSAAITFDTSSSPMPTGVSYNNNIFTITHSETGHNAVTIKIYNTDIYISGMFASNAKSLKTTPSQATALSPSKIKCGVEISYTESDITYEYEGFLIKDVIIINETKESLYDFIQRFKLYSTEITCSDYKYNVNTGIKTFNYNVDQYESNLGTYDASSDVISNTRRVRTFYLPNDNEFDDIGDTTKSNYKFIIMFDDYVMYINDEVHLTNSNNTKLYIKTGASVDRTTAHDCYKVNIYDKNNKKFLDGVCLKVFKHVIVIDDEFAAANSVEDLLSVETFTLSQRRINFNNTNGDKHYYLGFHVNNLQDHITTNRKCRNGTVERKNSEMITGGKKFKVDEVDITTIYNGKVIYDAISYPSVIIGNVILINITMEKIKAALDDMTQTPITECKVKQVLHQWNTQTNLNIDNQIDYVTRSVYYKKANNDYDNINVGAATKTYTIKDLRNMDLFNVRNISSSNFSIFIGSCEYSDYIIRDCISDNTPTSTTAVEPESDSFLIARGLFLDYIDGSVLSCVLCGNYIFKDPQYSQLSKIIENCRKRDPLITINYRMYNKENPNDVKCDCFKALLLSTFVTTNTSDYTLNITSGKQYKITVKITKDNVGNKTFIITGGSAFSFKFISNSITYTISYTADNKLSFKQDTSSLLISDFNVTALYEIGYKSGTTFNSTSPSPTSADIYSLNARSTNVYIVIASITDNNYMYIEFGCKNKLDTGTWEYAIPNTDYTAQLDNTGNLKILLNGTSQNFKVLHHYNFEPSHT